MYSEKTRASIYRQEVQKNLNTPKGIFLSWVAEGSTVLDVGCACGDLGKALKDENGCVVQGLEYNNYSIEIAKQTNAYENIIQCDLNNYKEINISEKFDYIVFGDVLEHIHSPKEVINYFKNSLKPEGEILISLPNLAHCSIKANLLLNNFDYTPIGILDETHLKHFTYKTIAEVLAFCNLKIIDYVPTYWAGIYGTQKNDPYKYLPSEISDFILSDKHSHVIQYVVASKISYDDNLLEANLKILDEKTPQKYVKYSK